MGRLHISQCGAPQSFSSNGPLSSKFYLLFNFSRTHARTHTLALTILSIRPNENHTYNLYANCDYDYSGKHCSESGLKDGTLR
jgi:hypothetical protein